MKNIKFNGRLITSPIFLREIKALENIYSDKKQRFDSSIVIASGKRCKFNHVQVIVCSPISLSSRLRLRPFPTTFWLTCPYLTKLAGKIESQGGVSQLEEYIKSNGLIHDWTKYNLLHQTIRAGLLDKTLRNFLMRNKPGLFRNLMRGGMGGIKYKAGEVNAKCLHLQTASFLALNYHPGSDWLKAKSLFGSCENNLCEANLCSACSKSLS